MYVCMYVYVKNIHVCMYKGVSVCLFVCMYVCMYVCMVDVPVKLKVYVLYVCMNVNYV